MLLKLHEFISNYFSFSFLLSFALDCTYDLVLKNYYLSKKKVVDCSPSGTRSKFEFPTPGQYLECCVSNNL